MDTVTHNGTTVPVVKCGLYWFNGDLVWADGLSVHPNCLYLMVRHIVLESPTPGALHERRSVTEAAWRGRASPVLMLEAIPDAL